MNDPAADALCPVEHSNRNGCCGNGRRIREEGSVICLQSYAHATDNPMLPIRFCCRLLRPTGRTIDIRMLIPQETGSFVKFAPHCNASRSIYFFHAGTSSRSLVMSGDTLLIPH